MSNSPPDSGPNPGPIDHALLGRYLAGECTPADAALVDAWREAFPVAAAVTRIVQQYAVADSGAAGAGASKGDIQELFARVRTRIGVAPGKRGAIAKAVGRRLARPRPGEGMSLGKHSLWRGRRHVGDTSPQHHFLAYGLGIAACAFAVAMGLRIPFFGSNARAADTRAVYNYATPRAQRATLQFPDGSTVMLAPETRLRYTVNAHGDRMLDLQGDAYFTVQQTENQPFVVHTNGITTRVLGTAFDIRHYSADQTVRVAVLTGRVAVQGRTTPVVISAGYHAELTDSTVTIPTKSDISTMTGWTNGSLVLTNVPISVVLETASRWSGYELRLADSTLAHERVTTVLAVGDRSEMMQLLTELLNVTMTVEGNVITFHPRRESARPRAPIRRERNPVSFTPKEVGK